MLILSAWSFMAMHVATHVAMCAVAPAKESPPPAFDAQGRPNIQATAAVLIDAATGKVLYCKNPDQPLPNASTTKIMTAILTLEHGRLDELVTIDDKVALTPFTSIHLMKGEKISVRMLLYSALMRSANDACVALAEHIAGSQSAFAKRMTARAKQLGAKHTHFVTVNGLHDPLHYTSASDLALFARRAISFPLFNRIVSTRKLVLDRSKNHDDDVVFNRNHFLWRYPGADGIKTGYTKQAGKCLVGSATRGGWRLISVVLHSPDPVGESSRLMDYGFREYTRLLIARKGQRIRVAPVHIGRDSRVDLCAAQDLTLVVPRKHAPRVTREVSTDSVWAPVAAGRRCGTLYAVLDGHRVASMSLVSSRGVGRSRLVLMIFWIVVLWLIGFAIRLVRLNARKNSQNHCRRGRRFKA